MRNINLVNQSTLVSDADFLAAVVALRLQVSQHFSPAWGGLDATLSPVLLADKSSPAAPASESIYLLDNTDQAGALGYHELATGDIPVGFVFVQTAEDNGDTWSSVLSHELLEQLVDPYIDSCAQVTYQDQPAIIPLEVADPVEADSYQIGGVFVSNFVLPKWFQTDDGATTGPYDYLGNLSAPLSLSPGGYLSYSTDLQNWQQQFGDKRGDKADAYIRHGRKKRK